jgi:hypothetical protein
MTSLSVDRPHTTRRAIKGLERLRNRDSRWYLPLPGEDDVDDFFVKGDDGEVTRTIDQRGMDQMRATKINQCAGRLWELSRPRRDNYARYWGLYSNMPLPGLTPRKFNQRIAAMARGRLSLNACAAVSDSFTAKVTNQRPKVTFSANSAGSENGDTWDLMQRAETLEKFNDGMLYENDFYETGAQLESDCPVFGTAVVIVAPEGETPEQTITYKRDWAFSFFCDDVEAYSGDPRCMYRREWMDRLVAMHLWPEFAEEIASATTDREDDSEDSVDDDGMTDTVCLTWAWHLPSGKGVWGHGGTDTGDGMMCLTIGNVLVDKQPCTRYPFEFLYIERPKNGVWGRGLVEQIQGIQYELDKIGRMIQEAMQFSSLRFWIPSGANVNSLYLTDIVASGIPYDGPEPPTAITPPAVAPEVYQREAFLYQKAFEITGVSQLTAQSQKPAGLNSGKALETYADIESERFSVAFRQYQHLFLRLARQTIALCRELADENPDFAIKSITHKTMSVVKWADAAMNDNDYAMKEYATSVFAETPEARLQQIQDSLNSGSPLITPAEGRMLTRDPDLEAFDSLKFASYNLAQGMISDILNGRPVRSPVSQMQLQDGPDGPGAITLGQLTWLRAYGAMTAGGKQPSAENQAKLDKLSAWVDQAIAQLPPPPPPPPPPAPPPPPMMPAAPAPAPVGVAA